MSLECAVGRYTHCDPDHLLDQPTRQETVRKHQHPCVGANRTPREGNPFIQSCGQAARETLRSPRRSGSRGGLVDRSLC